MHINPFICEIFNTPGGNMQKKIQEVLYLFTMFIVCFGSLTEAVPAVVRTTMLVNNIFSETEAYMALNNIHFEKATYEYSNNDGRQIYLVTSRDPTVFQLSGQPFQKTVSVVNVRSTDGTAGIYVIEASFAQDMADYDLKRNGQTVATQSIYVSTRGNPSGPYNPNLPYIPNQKPPQPWCPGDLSVERIWQLINEAQLKANTTCKIVIVKYQYICKPFELNIYPARGTNCPTPTTWTHTTLNASVVKHMETYEHTVTQTP